MAVPILSPKLSQVITEIGLPLNSSLADCFTSANASGFDITYSGSKDRLSNFRNYTHSTLSYQTIHRNVTPLAGCTGSLIVTCYHNGVNQYPTNGDVVYNDTDLTSPLNGTDAVWKMGLTSLEPDWNCNVSSLGVISNLIDCLSPL